MYGSNAEAAGRKSENIIAHMRETQLKPLQDKAERINILWNSIHLEGITRELAHNLTSDDFDEAFLLFASNNPAAPYYTCVAEAVADLEKFNASLYNIPSLAYAAVDTARTSLSHIHYAIIDSPFKSAVAEPMTTLTTLEKSMKGASKAIRAEQTRIQDKINSTKELIAAYKANPVPQPLAAQEDDVPAIVINRKPPSFIQRHWGKMLTGALLVGAAIATAVFTLGIPHLVVATGFALSLAAKVAITAGAGVLGAGAGAGIAAKTAKVLGGKSEAQAAELSNEYNRQQNPESARINPPAPQRGRDTARIATLLASKGVVPYGYVGTGQEPAAAPANDAFPAANVAVEPAPKKVKSRKGSHSREIIFGADGKEVTTRQPSVAPDAQSLDTPPALARSGSRH